LLSSATFWPVEGAAFCSPLQLFCMSRARARDALRFASVPSAFCLWAEEGEVPAEGVAFPHATSPPYSSAPTTCEWIEFGSTAAFFLRFDKSREMWGSPLPYRRSRRCKARGDLAVHQARQPARAGRRNAPAVDALNPVTKAPPQPPKERSGGGSKLSAV
jgi:hypothetical protein